MRKRKNDEIKIQAQPEEKVLDVNATMQGTLRFDDPVNLRISGKFEGTLDTKGKLTIGNKATIKANITGESIQIEGTVTGNIKASRSLKLLRTARLTGDVEVPRLIIEDGAVLMGQVRMERGDGSDTSFHDDMMNLLQVAEYLEVDASKVTDWAQSGMLPGKTLGGEWMFDRDSVDEWVVRGRTKG